jgi:hypothetical protein
MLGMGPLTIIHTKNIVPTYLIECGSSLPYQDPIKIFDSPKRPPFGIKIVII